MSTRRLLRSIGYPDTDEQTPVELAESPELYDYARKNKVGSLYVKTVAENDTISELSERWEQRRDYQQRLEATLNRLPAEIPDRYEYAVVKSGYPWLDAKDIDLILFDDQLDDLESHLRGEGYEFKGRSPSSFDVVDPETDIQLDIQDAFSLQRAVYFDRETVRDAVEQRSLYGTPVPILERPADLALIVIHSVTEQLYLLKEFYTAVALLDSFSRAEFEQFCRVVDDNDIEPAVAAFFAVTAQLSTAVFDREPAYLGEIRDRYGTAPGEQRALRERDLKTPHRYSAATGIRTILGKARNQRFRRTLLAQVPRLARPSKAYYILSQILTRREREHYVHDTSDMGASEK